MKMYMKYEATKRAEKVVSWVAWHLPEYLVYWCALRVLAFATTGKYGNKHPDEISVLDAVEAWRTKNNPAY